MKTPLLLGIITALLFGSFAVSGMIAQAGPSPFETTTIVGTEISTLGGPLSQTLTCPGTHPFIISGVYSYTVELKDFDPAQVVIDSFGISEEIDHINNQYTVGVGASSLNGGLPIVLVTPQVYCANFNFPMGGMSMIGGELLDIDTLSLFVGAIRVNPVITGLVAITMGGVAAQAIWYVNSRRVKKN